LYIVSVDLGPEFDAKSNDVSGTVGEPVKFVVSFLGKPKKVQQIHKGVEVSNIKFIRNCL